MDEQICEKCGATLKECGTWHKCPQSFSPVCNKCHESCEHLRVLCGYMEYCVLTDKSEA